MKKWYNISFSAKLSEDDIQTMKDSFCQTMKEVMNVTECADLALDEKFACCETEAVECCPHCEAENTYPNYDVAKDGYVVKCKSCGREIFLCDECSHNDDNSGRKCDWKEDDIYSTCFRGRCRNSTKQSLSKTTKRANYRCDVQVSIDTESQTHPFKVTAFADTIEEAKTEAFKSLSEETAGTILFLSDAEVHGEIMLSNRIDDSYVDSDTFDGVVKGGTIVLDY